MKFINFIKNRFNTKRQTGLYLTIGVVLASSLIYAFLNLVEDLFDASDLLIFDKHILNIIEALRAPILNKIMLFITYLGNSEIVIIPFFIVLIILIILRKWRYFYSLLISFIGGEIFVYITKNVIGRQRPSVINALTLEKDFSFPSGHSYIAIAFYGLVIYFIFKILKSKVLKYFTLSIGIILILALGFSRLYLGVHWPSDVLASFASSAALLTMIITFLEIKDKFRPVIKVIPEKTKKTVLIVSSILFSLWIIYLIIFYLNNPLK